MREVDVDTSEPDSAEHQSEQEVRVVAERHAVNRAVDFYAALGATDIEELGKPYDLRLLLNGRELHVEVKGSIKHRSRRADSQRGESRGGSPGDGAVRGRPDPSPTPFRRLHRWKRRRAPRVEVDACGFGSPAANVHVPAAASAARKGISSYRGRLARVGAERDRFD